jgi:hypothetical protein
MLTLADVCCTGARLAALLAREGRVDDAEKLFAEALNAFDDADDESGPYADVCCDVC